MAAESEAEPKFDVDVIRPPGEKEEKKSINIRIYKRLEIWIYTT